MDSLLLSSIPPLGDIMNLLFILFILLAFPIGIGYMLWYLLWDSSAIFRGIVKFIWYVPLFPMSLPFRYFQRVYRAKAFERKASKLIPKTNEVLERLKEFFLPTRRVEHKEEEFNKEREELSSKIDELSKEYGELEKKHNNVMDSIRGIINE